jgi:RNA polymerase sigma-70 factor (ECF subfamily)
MNRATMTLGLPCPIAVEIDDAEPTFVARLRSGELGALGEAYDRHHAHVRAFAQRLVGDASAAEDLVQETFVALPQAIHAFKSEASLRTFLVGIAVNHARHHVRAAARRRATMSRFAAEPPGRCTNPEHEAERAQLGLALSRALDELPDDQRVAFVLCEVEERTSTEVALILRVPEGTVRTRLFHARRKLRVSLEGVR